MQFPLLLLFLYVMCVKSNAVSSIAPVSLRNVCQIQFHFLLFIWFSIDFWWVILHSSSFVNLSVYFTCIFIIRFKHLFTNICSLLVIWLVVCQVSQAYNNTDFTFVHLDEQKSIGLIFSKSRTGSHVTYSCHHNSSRVRNIRPMDFCSTECTSNTWYLNIPLRLWPATRSIIAA